MFLIIFASVANRKVESVSPAERIDGEIVAIIAVNELPPKVSIQVTSKVTGGAFGKNETYEITQTLDAILESPYDELN